MILPGQYSASLAGRSLTNATVLLKRYQCKREQIDVSKVKELAGPSFCLG